MLIVVLGPDGSGKTTLAKSLADNIDGLSYIYFGNNIENRKYIYFNNFLKIKKYGFFNTLLKYIFLLINDFHYYNMSKKKHFISDRCPIDKLLGSKLNQDKGRYLYHKIIQSFMKKPDFIIFLYGDPIILYNRKKEIPINTIEYHINFYREYLSTSGINNIEIDTIKNDIENTFKISYTIIKELI